jgi:hypothetical protein
LLGTTRVVVSRILKKLENKGLIHLNVRLIFYEKDSILKTDMIEVIFKHLKRRYIGLHLNLNKMEGKKNIGIGFLIMGMFMLYGFLLIYLRDFAPNKLEWINNYSIGKHFESRLAHVHGNLFSVLNIIIGFLLIQFNGQIKSAKKISWLAMIGLLMPIGILTEVYFGLPPIFVLIGAVSMTGAVIWLGISFLQLKGKE